MGKYEGYANETVSDVIMNKKGLLMKIEWPKAAIFDDGKQDDSLTGAAHPGCCKQ